MAKYALPSRSSRGSRINKLIGEAAEADETFWNNEVWAEGEDDDYSTEAEEEDVVDSDFFDDEAPDDDVHDADEERPAKRARNTRSAFKEPVPVAPKRPRRAAPVVDAPPMPIDVAPMEVRSSTINKRVLSHDLQERYAIEARKAQAEKNAAAPKVVVRMTQAQLLAEAVRTEVDNTQSLNRLERMEEEKRADDMVPKAKFTGPAIRYYSSLHTPKLITFLNADAFPAVLTQGPPQVRRRVTKPTEAPELPAESIETKPDPVETKPDPVETKPDPVEPIAIKPDATALAVEASVEMVVAS
ncbi:hypothetical protein SPRG_05799 [Saprolegnia parasitica CBS 223.65]|uniref:Vps72/YL1 N-terminal domain-containing protein n=1 Tax=Saprolegnia parasitica (strain CBS 223.65) TaxID=695850 RepID=A0A067CQ35_SAPPC|nr:hypothetical protein SPRG_05799 [Saprolegnia parasitica CBS 223.65]KDO28927.1 hypothetical protein SPRG_05799 [Saprolegnia parasitica CBS 223.65]|eukprot:XP_012200468.1 hypothetical protein SPRG_05799 [Saprolegnia parasitica CBS 223.65]